MHKNDDQLLECLEDIYFSFEQALEKVKSLRSVHVSKLMKQAEELRSQRRIFEEISFPARLIVEHMLECQDKNGQVSLETDHFTQPFSTIGAVKVEEFGIIKIILSELEIVWRDRDYTYYFYPDKIELRAIDEKSAIKLFFTLGFGKQLVEEYPELVTSPNVVYIHPQILEWSKKVF